MSVVDPGPAVSRRAVLTAAAAGVGATACGTPAAPPAGPRPATPPADPRPDDGARAVARTDEIPVGGGRVFPDARVVVTQPSPGEFRGFGIVCTHDGCELNGVSGGTITCPCHGSRYAITDGSVVQGPARTGLRREAVAVEGDRVMLLGSVRRPS